MSETTIKIVDGLRGQQEQLKRLIAQKMWISHAPKATLSEIKAQLSELKRLVGHLESSIRDQLKERTGEQPMKQRSANAVAKARDLADQEIDKLSNQSGSAAERHDRKQRLLKGPKEFTDIRDAISGKPKS